jgi:hypothetical protein
VDLGERIGDGGWFLLGDTAVLNRSAVMDGTFMRMDGFHLE